MEQYLLVILPVVGIIIGAILQFLFSQKTEEWKWQQQLRTQAYIDYFKCVASISAKSNGSDSSHEDDTMLLDAKARVAIYGGKEVVNKIANLPRFGKQAKSTRARHKLLIDIVQAMRNENRSKKQEVSDEDISYLLFSKDTTKNSEI
jgi:hypothetical protein